MCFEEASVPAVFIIFKLVGLWAHKGFKSSNCIMPGEFVSLLKINVYRRMGYSIAIIVIVRVRYRRDYYEPYRMI